MSSHSEEIERAKTLPYGAHFYRCALQVNPYAYLRRHGKNGAFDSEAEYNDAIIDACRQNNIDVIGVTDHYRIRESEGLIKRASDEGLYVFPGFEAATEQNVHFLVLFDPGTDIDSIQHCISRCIPSDETDELSPLGDKSCEELMELCRDWDAACIAAHVINGSGLLEELNGKPRMKAWTNSALHAVSVPCRPDDIDEHGLRRILKNKDKNHRRDRLPAMIRAKDVDAPSDMANPKSSTWIKMAEPTIEGLRQAFLDHESRIRWSNPGQHDHAEFVAMTWEGGFLGGMAIHFNEDMNVLVGGRGTGKSTVIESLRYVLGQEPLGESAKATHQSVVQNVLGNGTKVSLLIQIHRPSKREYLIERTVPNPPKVRDPDDGNVLNLSPLDLLPDVEIYGQHEVAELAKEQSKLVHLLDRFADIPTDLDDRKRSIRSQLADTRRRLLEIEREVQEIDDRLDALPAIEETLEQYRDAGVEERLHQQSTLVREKGLLDTAKARIGEIQRLQKSLDESLPIDRTFISPSVRDELVNPGLLSDVDDVLESLSGDAEEYSDKLERLLESSLERLSEIVESWEEKKEQADEQYEQVLRDLQDEDVDGEEFLKLREKVEELRPLRKKREQYEREREKVRQERRNLLAEWESALTEEYRAYDEACTKIRSHNELRSSVRVSVEYQGDRSPLEELLDEQIDGRRQGLIKKVLDWKELSLTSLAGLCRGDSPEQELSERFGLTENQAKKLSGLDLETCMKIEELELPPETTIELNVGDEQDRSWRTLDQLSTGQRATAVLLLLLLESDTPLVIDQPEDDLDNRFVVRGVIPAIRKEKGRRQFLFATHNANIPVLGDAEQILGLTATGHTGAGRAEIPDNYRGAIDQTSVRTMVEDILEGGEDAFEKRRAKYGF
jgi:energy-coupling factor transporter ATP-binding protein EcfA2